MSIPRRRWLEKFTDAGGSNAYVFPRFNHEWEPSQPLRTPILQLAGASYGVNTLEHSTAPKGVAIERVRFLFMHGDAGTIDSQVDAAKAQIYSNATGKLWTLDDNGDRRWARAFAAIMPEMVFSPGIRVLVPVVCEFIRLSDWYSEIQTVVTEAVSATPTDFSVPNSGNAPVGNAVIEFQANAAGGFQALTMESLSGGDAFSSDRVAESGNSILRVDAGRRAVQYSNDSGVTWVSDYANFSYGNKQVDFMRFFSGSNSLRYSQTTGTPNLDIVIRFYPAWD